jgi:hypothetical protein
MTGLWGGHRRSGKRAQMEMMGLVVIVILLTLGMFFMVSFGLNDDKSEQKFTRKGLATSTMGAIMKATTGPDEQCGLIEFENDLLEDCAINFGSPDYAFQHSCSGMNSCDFMNFTIYKILNSTLWEAKNSSQVIRSLKKRYHLTAETITFEGMQQDLLFSIIDPAGLGCPLKSRDKEEETYFVNTGAGQVKTTLRLC